MQPGSAPQGGSLSQQNIYFWILQTEDPAPDYSFPSSLQQLKKKICRFYSHASLGDQTPELVRQQVIYEELIVLILVSAVYAEFALPGVPAADTAGELQHPEVSPIAQKKPCSHHKALF